MHMIRMEYSQRLFHTRISDSSRDKYPDSNNSEPVYPTEHTDTAQVQGHTVRPSQCYEITHLLPAFQQLQHPTRTTQPGFRELVLHDLGLYMGERSQGRFRFWGLSLDAPTTKSDISSTWTVAVAMGIANGS